MGGAGGDGHWVAEAVVDFLRGPMYIHPLMSFIDEKCLCFTPDEENKFEYTDIHNEFKDLVDRLLTGFIEELGVTPEDFYKIMEAEQGKDSLSAFVVQTILTVDDFLMFKAMMVKRNVDLTNQVLDAVNEMRVAHDLASPASPVFMGDAGHSIQDAIDKELSEVVKLSETDFEHEQRLQRLQMLMRSLQLQDEDVAMAIAIANSLRDGARSQAEMADLDQALALSMALEAEQKRLKAEQEAAERAGAQGAAALAAAQESQAGGAASSGAKGAGAKGKDAQKGGAGEFGEFGGEDRGSRSKKMLGRPFPEPGSMDLGQLPALGGGVFKSTPTPKADPLAPLNVGPNTAAEKMAAVAAAAAEAASLVAASQAKQGLVPIKGASSSPSTKGSQDVVGKVGAVTPAPLNIKDKTPAATPSSAPKEKFVPQPLNLPDKQKKEYENVPGADELAGAGAGGAPSAAAGNRKRAAGYKSGSAGPEDLTTIREAAAAAAATQKGIVTANRTGALSEEDVKAQQWLQDAKMQLVAKKTAEREAEMAEYKRKALMQKEKAVRSGGAGAPKLGSDAEETERKRAALRDKLASKFKQDLMGSS